MKIKQAEELTGLTAKNIRFYEKQKLLVPARDKSNLYRDYTEDDIERLKKIRLLRKLGVSLEHIRLTLDGMIKLQDCIDLRQQEIDDERARLAQMKAVCDSLEQAGETLETLDTEHYLHEIERQESCGARFINILFDCVTFARNILPKAAFWFEPENPILSYADFTDELVRYCSKTGKLLEIVHEGMEPIARIDGRKYLFILETPRTLHFRGSIFYVQDTFGFRFAYAYPYQ